MSLDLLGIGTALPRHFVTRQETGDAAPLFCHPDENQARLLPVLFRKAGVDRRYSVLLNSADGPPVERQDLFSPSNNPDDQGPSTATRLARYEQHAPALAEQAGRSALNEANCLPDQITHLVTVSCSGFYAPGFDIAMIKRLSLSPGVARTHLGFMGCHGAMNALRVAHGFVGADPNARVLVCALELCGIHYQYGWSPEKIVTNAIFSDGAAATVCGVNTTQPAAWRLIASGSVLLPDSEDAMTWRIGDHGFQMTLSAKVPELIEQHLAPWLETWLGEHGLTCNEVASWAVHPGGPRILQAVAEALSLDRSALEVSRSVLADYGNMSSPTILFVLNRLREREGESPCVALGFGPGLVAEAMLLE